jgi:hypothetical protein
MSKPKSQQKQALPSSAHEPIQLSMNKGRVISALPLLLLYIGNYQPRRLAHIDDK